MGTRAVGAVFQTDYKHCDQDHLLAFFCLHSSLSKKKRGTDGGRRKEGHKGRRGPAGEGRLVGVEGACERVGK